jgi:hypothetical protein
VAAEVRGRAGAAEDRRRPSFEQGGAVRRPRERRRPRAAVAGGQAGGGGGGASHLNAGGDGSRFRRQRWSVFFFPSAQASDSTPRGLSENRSCPRVPAR